MEAKLREYRAIRKRKELIDNAKEKLEKSKEKIVNFLVPKSFRKMDKDKIRKEEEVLLLENEEYIEPTPQSSSLIMEDIDATSETSEIESIEENQESWKYFTLKWSIYTAIWITLYMYFLSIQFGAVFFVVSVLIGICVNTRTRPKRKGEVSAYSVFNQNCVSIDGTLNAEDLQRQMLYGVAGAKMF